VLFHGQAMNITCVRYLDAVSFGFTTCPDALGNLADVPDYMSEALDELERASFARVPAHAHMEPPLDDALPA
jgi:hypothetical protein